MKKTIKEDQSRLVLESDWINENALLECVADHGEMLVTIRFIEANGIKEHVLLKMNIVEYMKHKEHLLKMNENKEAIAIYSPTQNGYMLTSVYNTVEHEFGIPEFVDCEYRKYFNNSQQKQYTKSKEESSWQTSK